MAKKPAGLGRSLGDLLEDNTPEIRREKGSASLRQGEETIRIAPAEIKPKEAPKSEAKSLYGEPIHKNRSVRANFKNFK